MATLGTYTLLAAFVACAFAAAACVAGARRRVTRLVESGIGAFYLVTALMTLASAIMVHAFVTHDYSIRYVDRYSDSVQPLFYKLTSYWGGLDGSIMFWVFLLAVFGSIAVRTNRERHRELIPYFVATVAVVQMFFLFIMVVSKNPFATYLLEAPADGRGLNPLLQNPYMVIHPPSLYTGLVAMTIPFAFGMAALITGHLDDSWLRAVRRWTMFSWFFLSLGLTLGMIWAYEELGWGGWWGWDPVENAGALPWFPATAFLHSVMVQERRSMLRVWNMSLIILAFVLTLFATAMTRTGIVQSVHAFGEDPELAMMFGIFITAVVVVSFGLVIYRLPLLRARNELESWASREAAFLVNNWILLFSAFFILFATMFPTLSEAVTGQRITVGPPFFNRWMIPIGLALLLLTGIGPLLAWRKSTLVNLRDQFLWPVALAVATAAGLYALGFRVWVSGLCFALCAFVVGTVGQEFVRGAVVRCGVTGTDLVTAMIGLVMRSRRRYGGYVVHLGIVLMMLGFAGAGYRQTEQVLLTPGEEVEVGRFAVQLDRLSVTDDGRKEMHTAHVTVFEDGRDVGRLYPGRWFYRKHEAEPTTEVAMRRTLAEDVYVVLAAYDMADQSASFQVTVNPLVNWIWLGFALLALGTGIALLPESRFAFLAAREPTDADGNAPAGGPVAGAASLVVVLAVAAALVLLLALGAAAAPAGGQGGPAPESFTATTPLEAELQRELVCTCGDCPHYTLADCRCSSPPRWVARPDGSQQLVAAGAEHMRGQLREQIEAGRDRRQILDYFIAAYGSQEPLGAPLDEGFNRLAWLLPYVVGLGCLVGVGSLAIRWSRRDAPGEEVASLPAAEDAELDARLDDELRDLD
ncbi:MAG: cytochrome c biogenesis protein CcsA [Acidobacteria bacterium]|nr:cytochrome c biogenesis protein CcsA [Acidobacteriota bacterium]